MAKVGDIAPSSFPLNITREARKGVVGGAQRDRQWQRQTDLLKGAQRDGENVVNAGRDREEGNQCSPFTVAKHLSQLELWQDQGGPAVKRSCYTSPVQYARNVIPDSKTWPLLSPSGSVSLSLSPSLSLHLAFRIRGKVSPSSDRNIYDSGTDKDSAVLSAHHPRSTPCCPCPVPLKILLDHQPRSRRRGAAGY